MTNTLKNNVALTIIVKSVIERSGYRIGQGEMIFQPNGKPAFSVAVEVVAKVDEKVASAIVVGSLNVMGRLHQKVRDIQGTPAYEYALYPTEIKPARPADCWRSVTFTIWTTADAEMKYSNGGKPYTKVKGKIGMGKENKPLWIDVAAFTVGEDSSTVESLNEVLKGATIEVHGRLDCYRSGSGKNYFSVNLFPVRESEDGKKGAKPLTIVKNGTGTEDFADPGLDGGAASPSKVDLSRFGFNGIG
jgi:hypothetical protein